MKKSTLKSGLLSLVLCLVCLVSINVALPPALAATIATEFETSSAAGDGVINYRSNASNDQTILLHTGQTRSFTVNVSTSGPYTLNVRYSNDNWGLTEIVNVLIDNNVSKAFTSQDTGNHGHGWNIFVSDTAGVIFLDAGSHSIAFTIESGDGWGIEMDKFELVAQTARQNLTLEAETASATGDGSIMHRSNASNLKTVLMQTGQQRTFPLNITVPDYYEMTLRYANDNWGNSEEISVLVDNNTNYAITAKDTGDGGFGWNIFERDSFGSVFLDAGTHEITVGVTGGDGYGIEIDCFSFSNGRGSD